MYRYAVTRGGERGASGLASAPQVRQGRRAPARRVAVGAPRPRRVVLAAAVLAIACAATLAQLPVAGVALGGARAAAGYGGTLEPPAKVPFAARGGVRYAYVVGARRGEKLRLLDRRGRVVRQGRADDFGSLIFRELAPGRYRVVRAPGRSPRTVSLRVLRPGDNPPASFYRRIRLHEGLNYVRMRDGIKLAMTVRLPPGKTLADGPFPTVVEYSGYQVAAPHDLLSALAGALTGGPGGVNDPLAPATSTAVGSVIAPLLGFATVSVQMRGSGCSGGDFDLFDLPTTYDGYDAIETVAAQPWVKGGKVGMVGISFSGISQLFVAGTRPPHLAAIAPLSVTDDLYEGTGYPGGIFNSGFAQRWVEERQRDAEPAPYGGQPYARELVRRGDQNCARNQLLRLQTQDALALQQRTPFRDPRIFGQRSPGAWLQRARVPIFLVGQFQDEQTGGHFPEALNTISRRKRVWITLQNGTHVDALSPSVITRWVEFLKLYVADEVPRIPDQVLALGGVLYRVLADAPAAPLEQSRFAAYTSVASARSAFERDPRVRVLMENGAGRWGPGSLGAPWELAFDRWPPREAVATALYFRPAGGLGAKPRRASAVAYRSDPTARPMRTLPGASEADAWKPQPPYDWRPLPPRNAVAFMTAPLPRDTVVAGPGSVDLWLRSAARDTDIQVTLTEVRPDGNEVYVQNGWLRASHRHLDRRRSSVLDPRPTHLERDAAPLPRGRWALVRVPLWPVAHVFRAGSRIRIVVSAPGGDRPSWEFQTIERGKTVNKIALGGRLASRVVLAVVRGKDAGGHPLPPAGALRGQPVRRWVAAGNGG